jgi:ParB/RepB/Spo0J family partition protein
MSIEVEINKIHTVSNYRKTINEKGLKELEQSIKSSGVLQPILLRDNGGVLELIAGHRRLKACINLGLVTIPAEIKTDVSEEDFFKFQLIENLQRENVPFMEEARGLGNLRDKCDMTVSEIAAKIGKSEQLIYFQLALLRMVPEAIDAADKGEITRGVAWRIARIKDPVKQAEATAALRRKQKDKLVSDRFARRYLEGELKAPTAQPRKNAIMKINGNDYAANWKKYLVNFSRDQFINWKAIVDGRTDTTILSEAVEAVMLESDNANP